MQIFPGHSIILIPRSGWLRDSEQAITAFELGLRFGVAVDDGSRVCPTSSVERTVAVLNPLHPDQLNTIIDATLGLALGKLGRWRGVEVRGSVSGEFGRVSVSPYSDDTWGDFYQLLTARGAIGLSRRLDLRVAVSVPINLSEPGLPNRDLVVPFGREEKELGTVLGVGIKIL